MHCFSVATLSLVALIAPVFASLTTPMQTAPSYQGTTLRPIKPAEYEASMGIRRRGSKDLSSMDPRNHTHLIYGNTKDSGQQLVLANLTLHAQDGLPIVALEHFEELTDEVDCRGDEGRLDLTFGSEDAFEYARAQWGYVNKGIEGMFLLVVNDKGCGGVGERQAYVVDNVTDDAGTWTTSLAAKAVAWSEVAGSYSLAFGQKNPAPRSGHPKRSLWDKVDGDLEHSFSKVGFNISAGHPDQKSVIFQDLNAGLSLDCTNCFLAGFFDVQGHILVHNFALQDLVVTASPRSVLAALELEATITASETPQSLSFDQLIISQAIYGAGIGITNFMNLGAFLTYSVSGDCTFSGSASASFGVDASLPDSAVITADYQNHGASSASGFDSTDLTPMFRLNNGSASVTLSATSKPEIKFGFDLYHVGNVDVAVTVDLPEARVTLSAVFDENGVCDNDSETSKTGVKVESEASIAVDLGFDAKMGSHDIPWSTPLWSSSKPLPSKCFPVVVPGLNPSPIATSGPAPSATPSASANVSATSAAPTPNLRFDRRWPLNSSSVSHLLASVPQASSPSRGERMALDVLSRLGMTGIPTFPTPSTSSSTSSSSKVPSTTSTDGERVSASTLATSIMSPSTASITTRLSAISTNLSATSTYANSSTDSEINTAPSSIASTASSPIRMTSKTTASTSTMISSIETLTSSSAISGYLDAKSTSVSAEISTSSKITGSSSLSSRISESSERPSSSLTPDTPSAASSTESTVLRSTTSELPVTNVPSAGTTSSAFSKVGVPSTLSSGKTSSTTVPPSAISSTTKSLSTHFSTAWSSSKASYTFTSSKATKSSVMSFHSSESRSGVSTLGSSSLSSRSNAASTPSKPTPTPLAPSPKTAVGAAPKPTKKSTLASHGSQGSSRCVPKHGHSC